MSSNKNGGSIPTPSGAGAISNQQIDNDSVVNPPSVIDIPNGPEGMSCASSVTTHFQDAALFVPHMYPSAQSLRDSDDNLDDATFQPVTQQPKATTHSVMPPLQEELSQHPTDSKSTGTGVSTSHQRIDENRLLKEHPKATIQDVSPNFPSMTSLESRINQKTQIYSIRPGSFEMKGEDEVARNLHSHGEQGVPVLDAKADLPNSSKEDRFNAAKGDSTTSQSPTWLQDLPMPQDMPISSNINQASLPGAHPVFPPSRTISEPSPVPTRTNTTSVEEHGFSEERAVISGDATSLAEANLVHDSELPIATAQPGNKHLRQRTYFPFYLMGCLCFFLVVVAIIVGAVCSTGHCSQKVYVDASSTIAPTTARDAVAAPKIEVVLTSSFGKDYFQHVDESGEGFDNDLADFLLETRQKAFDWIVNQDPMQLEYDSPNLVQRFLLVLFYYQTTRHQPWKECNQPAGIPQGSAMSGFCYAINQFSGEITTNIWGDRWLSASHECQWAGITCGTSKSEEKRIVRLILSKNQLNGPLPWEILYLAQLKRLELGGNMLTGMLSPGLLLGEYALALELLSLTGNRLSGTIPGEWFVNLHKGSGKLEQLRISRNRLTGTIPSEVGLLSLKWLQLGGNALTGSLPMDLFYQKSFELLYFEDNQITGTMPTEVGLLANLRELYFCGNSISGSLPSDIGLASQLSQIMLFNTNMQGTLPEELYTGLTDLIALSLNDCNFSGTISSSLGLLTNLAWLNLANNHFLGTIPNEIETLTGLSQLLVNGNKLSGTVPLSVCQNFASEILLVADCLPNTETEIPVIQCAFGCCTSCCDETGVCLAN